MREYIDKQELLKNCECRGCNCESLNCDECNEYSISKKCIEQLKTYTQAEIEHLAYNRGARAFAENLKEKLGCGVTNYLAINKTREIVEVIEELLKEMGCCGA